MEDGVDFRELSEFKELLNSTVKAFPKECKRFLKNECKTLKQRTKQCANSEVGKSDIEHKHYVDGFKVGKPYDKDDELCCRVYNNAPHAHLIENGHKIVTSSTQSSGSGGFVEGKYIIQKSSDSYEREFLDNTERFLLGEYEK